MAFASDSTTAPARPLLPIMADRLARARDARGRFVKSVTVTDFAAPEPRAELQPGPLLPASVPNGGAGNQPAQIRSVDQIGISDVVSIYPGNSEVAPIYPDAVGVVTNYARAIHLRRQLVQAAEHGAALLASLGLPRLVTPDFAPLDPMAIGDAVDRAIRTLDALDGDTDVEDGADDEPSLGWIDGRPQFCGDYQDRELDTADAEPSLASPERHPTIPLSFRDHPYTARGGDEGQLRWSEGARDDREVVDEDGPIDEDELDGAGDVDREPSIGWPEDFTAEVAPMLEASADAEHDNADAEDGDDDDDRTAEDSGLRVWVFGPSRREVAHA